MKTEEQLLMEKMLDEIERLQAELAAQAEQFRSQRANYLAQINALQAAPQGDMVLVPRELVEEIVRYASSPAVYWPDVNVLQARLDAPPVRVVGEGDVVVPAVVAVQDFHVRRDRGTPSLWLATVKTEGEHGDTAQAAIDKLAASLTGESAGD